MCDFIKRHMTLRAGQKPSVIDSVQLFLDLSATNNSSAAREAISRGDSSWMHQVLTYKDVKIVQSDIAEATLSTQSKVSRRLKSAERA